ncbi:LysM peptidoglycan-binding domain-containing protein [Microbacterium sp. P04]|uniref:LysM peptidoglycan-binding domain-containing protein n=1 Tax=Microbacterium sp. P04 TaxID=3366947 RepID=UPI0037467555
MERKQTITVAACAVVVGGLVALALPAVASTIALASSWALFSPVVTESTATTVTMDQVAPPEDDTTFVLEDGTRLQTIDGQTFSAEGPGDCTTNAAISPYGAGDPDAALLGELVDMGATELAAGAVGYNADGQIATYTVEPGDSLISIGERFCVDYVTIGAYNDRFGPSTIQPGDVLILRPEKGEATPQ